MFWARFIKGICFPNTSFLNASRGNKASWAWSSLIQGRDLLEKGLRWQVQGTRISGFLRCPISSYSVKSGYQVALDIREGWKDKAENLQYQCGRLYGRWRLFPRLGIFWWRVSKNRVATRENLFACNCASNPLCPVCSKCPESIEHLLFGV